MGRSGAWLLGGKWEALYPPATSSLLISDLIWNERTDSGTGMHRWRELGQAGGCHMFSQDPLCSCMEDRVGQRGKEGRIGDRPPQGGCRNGKVRIQRKWRKAAGMKGTWRWLEGGE